MPEVKSARELAESWIKYNASKSIEYNYDILSTDAEEDLADMISRDRATMLEKYKEAIKKAEARSKKMQLCANDAIAALDSTLAEIEGGN